MFAIHSATIKLLLTRGMDGCEDKLDVDDSDLHAFFYPQSLSPFSSLQAPLHFLHPCSQNPCSSQVLDLNSSSYSSQFQLASHISNRAQIERKEPIPKPSTSRPIIPGPAGIIQKAMRRESTKTLAESRSFEVDGRYDLDLCVREEGDFKLNPWLCSLSFLGKIPDSSCSISAISAQKTGTKRIPLVVGIVKSSSRNGLGDLFITLKDPTGTIGATIHRKVLSEGKIGGEILVGCVFILKQVVAICPTNSSCYLNITLKNVVKLISKDCGPPEQQIIPPFAFMQNMDWNGEPLQTELPARQPWLGTGKIDNLTTDSESRQKFTCEMKIDSATKESGRSLVSRASVEEWTDEQLEMLFCDY